MKISTNLALTHLISGKLKSLLLFGNDEGSMKIFLKKIKDNFAEKYQFNNYLEVQQNLRELLINQNLFNNTELLIVYLEKAIIFSDRDSEFLDKGNYNNRIIFIIEEQNQLNSSLKNLFSNSSQLGLVAFFHSPYHNFRLFLQDALKDYANENINFSPTALEQIAKNTSNNKMLALNEMKKVICYAKSLKSTVVTAEMIDQVKSNINYSNFDNDIAFSFLNKSQDYFLILASMRNSGWHNVGIIRVLIKYCSEIYMIKKLLEEGEDFDSTIALVATRANTDKIKLITAKYHSAYIGATLMKLVESEIDLKSSLVNTSDLLQELFIKQYSL